MNNIVLTGSQSGMGWIMRQYLESQGHPIIGVDLPGKGAEVDGDLSTFEGCQAALDGVIKRGIKTTFQPIPLEKQLISARQQVEKLQSASKAGGYDPIGMAEMQATLLFLDPMPAIEALKYDRDDLAQAIRDTVAATPVS